MPENGIGAKKPQGCAKNATVQQRSVKDGPTRCLTTKPGLTTPQDQEHGNGYPSFYQLCRRCTRCAHPASVPRGPSRPEQLLQQDAFWGARYKRAVAEHAAATHAYCAAIARLPWWAAVGPSYATRGGLLEKGPVCGWPAVQTWEAPAYQIVQVLIRPGPHDLKKRFDIEASMWGRERALPVYRRKLRALAARLRAQKAEHEKAGVPAADASLDRASDELFAIEKAIEALPLSLTTGAATAFIRFTQELAKDGSVAGTSGSGEFIICLGAMRPHLMGPFAADIDDMLGNLDRPIWECWFGAWAAEVGEAT